jgi:HEAT repeat protein
MALIASEALASPQATQTSDQERAQLRAKLEQHGDYVNSAMWALVHAAESETEVRQFLETLAFIESPEPGNQNAPATNVKTAAEFKKKMADLLDSKDDVVCATAAIVLGALGDTAYVSRLAAELRSTVTRSSPIDERGCRGRSATALGLLNAKEHAAELVPLLQSKNPYDRAGAAQGLGLMKATEHAKAVGALLARLHGARSADANLSDRDDDSAIVALLEMGVGADYASEFELILKEPFGEVRQSAMFALARIGGREHAAAIAPMLDDRFMKGHAAVTLAVLQAKDYTAAIAKLLKSSSSLDQKDAALALALMNARETSDEIAALLTAPEDFVRYYAAVALTVLDPQKYAARILPVVQPYHAQGYRLNKSDLHPLLSEEYSRLEQRFLDNLKTIEPRK